MDKSANRDIAPAPLLHDDVAQELVAIASSVDSILTLEGLSQELREHFRALRSELSQIAANARDDIFSLSPLSDEEILPMPRKPIRPVALRVLTPTEFEILKNIATGATTLEIAHSRHNSEATIKAHLTSIYRKLEVRNRVEAIAKLN